jgi:hypothetical protein
LATIACNGISQNCQHRFADLLPIKFGRHPINSKDKANDDSDDDHEAVLHDNGHLHSPAHANALNTHVDGTKTMNERMSSKADANIPATEQRKVYSSDDAKAETTEMQTLDRVKVEKVV